MIEDLQWYFTTRRFKDSFSIHGQHRIEKQKEQGIREGSTLWFPNLSSASSFPPLLVIFWGLPQTFADAVTRMPYRSPVFIPFPALPVPHLCLNPLFLLRVSFQFLHYDPWFASNDFPVALGRCYHVPSPDARYLRGYTGWVLVRLWMRMGQEVYFCFRIVWKRSLWVFCVPFSQK